MISSESIARVIKSLMPKTQQELTDLQYALSVARRVQRHETGQSDVMRFLRSLPSDCMEYFHGLVEALEIYQSIYGEVAVDKISLGEKVVHELRQIRDQCLDSNLRCLY